jgi:hypothetical protein
MEELRSSEGLVAHFSVRWWYAWDYWPEESALPEGVLPIPDYPGVGFDTHTRQIRDFRKGLCPSLANMRRLARENKRSFSI